MVEQLRINRTYAQAIRREQIRGKVALFIWVALLLFVTPSLLRSEWLVGWIIFLTAYVLLVFRHYDYQAIRHRAFHNSDSDKPLI